MKPESMRVAFRVDASVAIGSGHVMRCLTLADALGKEGADVLFVCRQHHGNTIALIEERGFAVAPLAVGAGTVDDRAHYADWLGGTWQADAEATQAAVTARWLGGAEWLIVDHYAIDARWESALRAQARRIMAIDDLADRSHDSDLLLDQNLVRDFETRYAGLVPDRCLLQLGPRYALLASEYAALHGQARSRQGPIRNILVFFGGVDSFGLTEKAVNAFIALERPDIHLDVVVGRMSLSPAAMTVLAQSHPNIAVHGNLPSLAPLMAKADLAIGAGGSTAWERLCLGLPSIVVSVAENQRETCSELSRRGLAHWLGDAPSVYEATLLQAERRFLLEVPVIPRDSIDIVDGQGASRVAAKLSAEGHGSHPTELLS